MTATRLTVGELASVWADEPVIPFHIALLGVFDATPFLRGDGLLDARRIRAELVRRAGRVAALRRRVLWTRFGQGRPYWADDPSFDAGAHVTCAALPEGVTLTDWCARQMLRPLDRDRPLWRAVVVSGLPGDRFGLLVVVHHAVADGLTGIALAAALLDTGPDGRPEDPAAVAPAGPGGAPTPAVPGGVRQRWRQLTGAAADFRTRAPVTSLSRPIGPTRRLATIRIPLDDLHQAGHRLGVTVNDLLLAAVTAGLRDLLHGRGDALDGLVLRASVPVGARTPGQLNGMLVLGLPVGEGEPLCRLASIHARTALLKSRLRAGGGHVMDVLHLPAPAARPALRWMRRIAGGRINMFITNVPGPAAPLWPAGARLREAYPVAPLVRGVPLGVAALSYAGTLHVAINADAAVADLDTLARGVEREVTALLGAARARARPPQTPARPTGRRDARGAIEKAIEINREPAAGLAFMTDARHEPEWNPQLLEVEQLTGGPIGVGTPVPDAVQARRRRRHGHLPPLRPAAPLVGSQHLAAARCPLRGCGRSGPGRVAARRPQPAAPPRAAAPGDPAAGPLPAPGVAPQPRRDQGPVGERPERRLRCESQWCTRACTATRMRSPRPSPAA